MPTIEKINGKDIREDTNIPTHADIILSPVGVINRLNPSQLLEQELNFIAQHVRYNMEEIEGFSDKYVYALDFVSLVNSQSAKAFEYAYSLCSNDEEREEFLNEIIKNGFYIQQEAFWDNINADDLAMLYDKYNITQKYSIKNIETDLIFGEEYYFRLTCSRIPK